MTNIQRARLTDIKLEARVVLERLKVTDGVRVTDFGRKASDSEEDLMNDFLEPETETNQKEEEITLCMTEAAIQKFKSKREESTFTLMLEENSGVKESSDVKTEKKWEAPHSFLTELTDQFREEALGRALEIKSEEKQLEEQTLKCSHCVKSFKFPSQLKQHLRTYSGDKPFKCLQCSKSFKTSSNLKTHLKIHLGEKSFKCLECSKSFTQSVNLKTHLRIHSGEKPFKCLECSKSFNKLFDLKRHLKIHSGEKSFKCLECSKSFTQSVHLKTHLRIHSGEKPFKCLEVSKSFNKSSDLKPHLKIHSWEKPF
jgi:uncharacterized Zn-finger protein